LHFRGSGGQKKDGSDGVGKKENLGVAVPVNLRKANSGVGNKSAWPKAEPEREDQEDDARGNPREEREGAIFNGEGE